MHRDRRARVFSSQLWVLGVALALVAIAAGCGDDQPAECTRAKTGEFIVDIEPIVMDETSEFTATVTAVEFFASPPPIWDYRLRTEGGGSIHLQIKDAAFGLPVEVDSTYRFVLERHLAGNLIPANGMKIFDDDGLRYLAVYDWLPNFSVFESGFGDLDGDGDLQVFHQAAGCSPREENSERFKELTNYRLEFLIGADQRVKLWHGEQAQLGRWIISAHKSILIQVKSAQYAQNQVSFSVQRDDTIQ